MSKLTREIKQKRFRTPQAVKKIMHKLIDEVERLERSAEKPDILLPNFGIKHIPKESVSKKPAPKKSYYKKGGKKKNES